MVIMKQLTTALLLFVCLQFVGCASSPMPQPDRSVPVEERHVPTDTETVDATTEDQPDTTQPPSGPTRELAPAKEAATGSVIIALLEDADRYSTIGKREQAAASLERALRIEPKNPLLWNRLGLVRLQQGRWNQAVALAQKSNSLSGNKVRLQSNNWKIIAQAKAAMGDKAGAKQARQMAQKLTQ